MGVLVLVDPVVGTTTDATLIAANDAAIKAVINGGIDASNFGAGLIFNPNKIQQGGATTGQGMVWDGAKWAPASQELGYTEFTAPVNVTATTEATANTVVTASAVTFDGATPVWIEFYSPEVAPDNAAAARRIIFALYDGASSIGLLSVGPYSQVIGNSADVPLRLARRLTPAAATKTYSVRGFVNAGTAIVSAGAGGVGNQVPGYIRISRAA